MLKTCTYGENNAQIRCTYAKYSLNAPDDLHATPKHFK